MSALVVNSYAMSTAFQNFNAAKACFLPENEKKELLKKLRKAHGVPDID